MRTMTVQIQPGALAFFIKFSKVVPMSQDNLIKLVHTQQDEKTGKKKTTHVYWSRKNKKKLANHKLEFRKFNPVLKKHVTYKEAKK